ncbi:MAG: hypothetical protein Q8905_11080 [Bacteroidota bacterium]|nr:hypothetical protein [Bacteroidota bacterium]
MNKIQKNILLALLIMLLLTPLGIILPSVFHSEGAWGEWSTEVVRQKTGSVPRDMKKTAKIWKAPLANYGFGKNNLSWLGILGYVISAVAGSGLIMIITYLLLKLFHKHD